MNARATFILIQLFVLVTSVSISAHALVAPVSPDLLSSCTQFGHAPELPTGSGPRGTAVADLDGDGRLDAAVTFIDSTQGVSVLRNLGEGKFAPKIDFVIPSGTLTVESVFAKDLDNDGRVDLVISSSLSNRIGILRNTGAGAGNISFAPLAEYVTGGNQSRSLTFGDFDGDGSVDIATGNRDSASSVSVFRNISAGTGTITLAARTDFPVVNGAWQIASADFDGDGKLDIGVGGADAARTFLVLRNTSTGVGNVSFVATPTFAIENGALGMTIADLDGDGKHDAIVSTQNGDEISILRNISSGVGDITFATRQDVVVGRFPRGVISADIDKDGKLDIAVGNSTGNSVTVLRNVSTPGTITLTKLNWDFGTGITAYNLTSGDMDGDGKTDLVSSNVDGDSISILHNTSSGSGVIDFVSRKDYFRHGVTGRVAYSNVDTADFDGDGNADIAASYSTIDNVFSFSIFPGNGSGHFPQRIDLAPTLQGHSSLEPIYVVVGDFDGDGKPDIGALAEWNPPAKGLLIYRNVSSAPGNFAFQVINPGVTFPSPTSLVVGDIDGDGKLDLVATYREIFTLNNTALVLRNTSGGVGSVSFANVTSFTVLGGGDARISLVDLNADAKTDVAYVNGSVGTLTIQVNTGTGPGQISFSPVDVSISGGAFGPTMTFDVDGDGRQDLVSATENFGLSIFLNTSSGGQLAFAPRVVYPNQGVFPRLGADIDGDGKRDLIATSMVIPGTSISIYKNASTGPGSVQFAPRDMFAFGGSLPAAVAADFNKDGRTDFALGLSLFINARCQSDKTPFDFDGDGKTDLGIFRPSVAEWWINRSSDGSTFAAQFGATADKLAPADYTGDGKADIAIWRPSSGEWFILRSEDSSFFSFPFGTSGDTPMPADYDADGKVDAAVFRASNATWYIRRSSDTGTTIEGFGANGDVPVSTDYDGDGKADIAIYRPSLGQWWIKRSTAGVIAFTFGTPTDKPVQGDYTGDGKSDVAFWRPSTGEWYILRSEDFSYYSQPFGTTTDIPSPGDYDGDGKFDPTVFRPSSATWFSNRSAAGTLIQQFGSTGDRPIPNAFVQ